MNYLFGKNLVELLFERMSKMKFLFTILVTFYFISNIEFISSRGIRERKIYAPGGCDYYMAEKYKGSRKFYAVTAPKDNHYLVDQVIYAVGQNLFIAFSSKRSLAANDPVIEIGIALGENKNLNFYSYFGDNTNKKSFTRESGILLLKQPNKIRIKIDTVGNVEVIINNVDSFRHKITDGKRVPKYISFGGWDQRNDIFLNCHV